ncbi:MAG: ATP-binding protein [Kofleriaceae bacterium]
MEKRARQGLHLVSRLVRTFSRDTASYERLLPTIAREIAEAIPDTCLVSLCNDDCSAVTPVAEYDREPAVVERLISMRRVYAISETPFASQAIERGTLLAPMINLDELAQRSTTAGTLMRALGARSFVLTPMRSGGQLVGLITLIRRSEQLAPLDELDVEILEDLAAHAALAISNARMVKKLASGEQLRDATMFLDTIIENIPDMVFVKEAENLSFVRFNRAGELLLGVDRAALIGKTDYDLFPKTEADFFTQKDRETLANKQLVEITEEPIQTSTGMRWLHTKKVPLIDDHGVARFLLGISQDITERKRADAQLRAANETVDHANRELESFAYTIAHDLRAPLRSILGYSQAVLEDAGDKLEGESRAYLQRTTDVASKMATQLEGLIGLARVGQADLVRSRVDLSATARSVVEGLRLSAPGRDVEITIASDLFVQADPHMIATVMENLIDNAWKFTAKRERACIEIGMIDAAVFVRDNGAGFDPLYVDELFGVFRRLHIEQDFPGTGVGLATVARIIHRHHGRVWAEGNPGAGATFYFTVGEQL